MLEEDVEFEQADLQGEEDGFNPGFADDGMDEDMDEDMDEMVEGPGVWGLMGQEVTVAFGKSSGENLGHLLKMNERASFFQAEAFGRAVQALASNGDLDEFSDFFMGDMHSQSFMKFLQDPESGVSLLDKAVFPPMYVAFRAKEGELEQTAQMVASSMMIFGMAGEMVQPVELETGGSKFLGYKLLGSKIAEMMELSREGMEEEMDNGMTPETMDALIRMIAKKNMVFATGTIGDYVVMMIGGDEAALQLVAEPKDSMGGSEKMGFIDEFADKPMLMVSYGDQAALKNIIDQAGGLATYAMGFRAGIAASEGLGEMRDIEELLQLFSEREKALLALGSTDAFGMVAYLDQGLKIDSFGGHDKGGVDWKASTRLAHLGNDPENLMFLSYPSNAAYNEQLTGYLELIAETTYALAIKFSDLQLEDPKMAEMNEYLKFFDKGFREDMLGLYQAISGDLMDGLGQESVFLVDMKGSMPAVAGVPQVLVDEARVPRMAMIAPVTDRAKLANAWKKMDAHSTAVLAKVSEMAETKIPMQKPISSEKDGMVTWFISMPFFQDNFLPSVTLNDQWFVASTSKVQATDLIGKASLGGDSGSGIKFRMNFNLLSEYADAMLKMAEKNADAVFTDEDARNHFDEKKSTYLKWIEASREFDSMSWDVRKEDGLVRSRIHFKMN
jgi:hypothetical protein